VSRADIERLVAEIREGILVFNVPRVGAPAVHVTHDQADDRARQIACHLIMAYKIEPHAIDSH